MKNDNTSPRRSTVRGLTAKEKKATARKTTAAKTAKRPRGTLDRAFDKWMAAGE